MEISVVLYGCESWSIKKDEHRRTDAFELWCWRRLLSPLYCKEIKPVNPKGTQSWIFTGRTHTEAEAPTLRPPNSKNWMLGKIKGRRRGQQRMRWLDDITDLMGHEFEQAPGVGDKQGGLACCSPCKCKELDTTELLNWTDQIIKEFNLNKAI